jgi:hypothetical protein
MNSMNPMDSDESSDLSDRHASTLNGKLAPLSAIAATTVTLVVSQAAARSKLGQTLAVWVANLMGRMARVVDRIHVVVEGGDRLLLSNVDPRDTRGAGTLANALLRNASLSDTSRTAPANTAGGTELLVGIGLTTTPCHFYASASAWIAYCGTYPGPDCEDEGGAAIGAVVSAAMLCGEIFKHLRLMHPVKAPTAFFFDAFTWRQCTGFDSAPSRESAGRLRIAFALAGAGAVGTAFLLALWGSDIDVHAIVIDGDSVARTNLNRYPLFSLVDLKQAKVERVRALLARESFWVEPHTMWWSQYQRANPETTHALLVSAVDSNEARHQLQDSMPRVILGASTNQLRIEVGRYDLTQPRSRCLKCFNAPELSESDAVLHRRLLGMEEADLTAYALEREVPVAQLVTYVEDLRMGGNGCALIAGDALARLRVGRDERQFAVSFVSAFAGAMLAAQVIREAMHTALLEARTTRAIFQMWRPSAPSNRPTDAPIDASCWCGTPIVRAAHTEMWNQELRTAAS